MIQRASSVGELAQRFISRGGGGTVTRVFRRSAYVGAGPDFFLLLWGDGRSPMTINVVGENDGSLGLKAGERCELAPSRIRSGDVEITLEGARTYRSTLRKRREVALPGISDLVKGVAAVRSLYDASPHGPSLVSDPLFRSFVEGRLAPAAVGTRGIRFDDFLGLVGRGGGFTPAGDDFTSGFAAVFNYIARSRRSGPMAIPRGLAWSRTIPESAAVMVYSSRGYVDEEMERLILDSLGRKGFSADLMSLASRGHTSGIDMSLGVLLAEAVESGKDDGGRAMTGCVRELWPG